MSNLDKLQQINTNVPRETNVHIADGLVFKRPNGANDAKQKTVWIEKQKSAQKIQDFLRAKTNITYFVPHMLEVSATKMFALEERVSGHPLTSSFVESLPPDDLDIIYRGLANFINDMITYKPILSQSEHFDLPSEDGSDKKFTFAYILNHIDKYISKQDVATLKKAKALFDSESLKDASVVFSHGDMNEHNAFYDPTTKTVSVIDVADAKYENANEMFYRNFARLGWLDIERLITEFNKLPHERPINIETDKHLVSLRNALHSFKWSAIEILKNPKHVSNAHIVVLREDCKRAINAYNTLKTHIATRTINTASNAIDTLNAIQQGIQNQKE